MLPSIESIDDYRPICRDDGVWLPVMRVICQRHGVDPALTRCPRGTHQVYAAGAVYLKLFCPLWARDYTVERAVLHALRGVPAPEILAEGELEGWPYLVLSAVPGVEAHAVWHDLDIRDRHAVMEQLGEVLATLHGLPPVPEIALDWGEFLQERTKRAREHHGEDAAEPWLTWIEEFLRNAPPLFEPGFSPVLLNADVTDDHLLLERHNGRWTITGLIDFADAMMGHPLYEFVAPAAFYINGEPELSRTLLLSYGFGEADLTETLSRQLTAYCLLHRYGRVQQFLERHPVDDLPGFRAALWPF